MDQEAKHKREMSSSDRRCVRPGCDCPPEEHKDHGHCSCGMCWRYMPPGSEWHEGTF